MKAISNDNVYYINRATQQKESKYDNVKRDFRYILRANSPDKSLSRIARALAANYDDMISKTKNKLIFVSHHFISTITEVGNRQNNNIHRQLLEIFNIKYHQSVIIEGRKYRDGFIVEYANNAEEILKNPQLYYSKKNEENCRLEGKKFPPRAKIISTSIYNELDNPIEEIDDLSKKDQSISKKEKINKKEKVPILANGSLSEPAKIINIQNSQVLTAEEEKEHYRSHANRNPYSNPKDSIGAMLARIETNLNNEVDIPMEQNTLTPEESMQLELNKAIFNAFPDMEIYEDVMDKCKFQLIAPDKMEIAIDTSIVLSAIQKEKLRTCIRSVYGETIKIVAVPSNLDSISHEANKEQDFQPSIETTITKENSGSLWNKLIEGVEYKHPENIAKHVIGMWFNKTKATQELSAKKLILTGTISVIDYINQNFGITLEDVADKNKMTIELRYACNSQKPIIFLPQNKRGK